MGRNEQLVNELRMAPAPQRDTAIVMASETWFEFVREDHSFPASSMNFLRGAGGPEPLNRITEPDWLVMRDQVRQMISNKKVALADFYFDSHKTERWVLSNMARRWWYDLNGKTVGYLANDGKWFYETFGKSIGFVNGKDIYTANGKVIGRFDDERKWIYDQNGKRLGYLG